MDNQLSNQETVETKKCSTCFKEIEVAKFRIHEIGCARNNYKCPTCGDIVAKAEKEEHEKEAHTKVQCQYCKIEFNKKDLVGHEDQCFMKPKPCKYCEQIIKFEEYEKHIGYCGSKTFKCPVCNHNICNKDEDTHNYGGECQAFIEQDKQKKIDEEKRKQLELKKFQEEEKQRREKQEKKQKEREERYKDNFDMDDLEMDENATSQMDRQMNVKVGLHKVNAATANKQDNLGSYMPTRSQQQHTMPQSQKIGMATNKNQLQAKQVIAGQDPLSGGIAGKSTAQQRQQQQQPMIGSKQSTQQQQKQVAGSSSKQTAQQQVIISNNRGINSRGAGSSGVQSKAKEEVKQPGVGRQLAEQIKPSKGNNGPIVNNNKNIFEKKPNLSQAPPSKNQAPPRQAKLEYNNPPLSKHQQPAYEIDENQEMIDRMLQEDEDKRRAEEMQKNLFQNDEMEDLDDHNYPNTRQAAANKNVRPPDNFPMQEQLIPGARQQFQEVWDTDEHMVADNMGYGGHHGGFDQTMGADDEEFQRVILESMKHGRGGSNIEDEQLQRALEESRKHV